jgi:hypothetical protein
MNMGAHTCPRCGFESKRDAWWERHPYAAVAAAAFVGLPAGYTLVGVTLAYPWFFLPLLVVVCAFVVDRRMLRRPAIAARADYGHRALSVAPIPPVRPLPQRQAHSLPWQAVRLLRTAPLRQARK